MGKGCDLMFVNHADLWPLAGVACGTVVVAALRCLMLFIGLRLTLRGAPRADRLAIYREFACALSLKSPTEEPDSGMHWVASSDRGWCTARTCVSRHRQR
jgi:hypothetical protein